MHQPTRLWMPYLASMRFNRSIKSSMELLTQFFRRHNIPSTCFTTCSNTISTVALASACYVISHFIWSIFIVKLILTRFIVGAMTRKSCTYMKSFWKRAASIWVFQKQLIPPSIMIAETVNPLYNSFLLAAMSTKQLRLPLSEAHLTAASRHLPT